MNNRTYVYRESAADVKRSLELAAYFTHCNLQPAHLMLALKTAMALAFKNKVSILHVIFNRCQYELCALSGLQFYSFTHLF